MTHGELARLEAQEKLIECTWLNVVTSVEELAREDWWLLENDLHERTITHRLAVHLHKPYPTWHVDCEYDKAVDTDKLIPALRTIAEKLKRRKTEPLGSACAEKLKESGLYEVYMRDVYPDIIVHHREHGEPDHNLLVIEVKKWSTVDPWDAEKLRQFTQGVLIREAPGELYFKYQLGLLLEFKDFGPFTPSTIEGFICGRFYADGQEQKGSWNHRYSVQKFPHQY